MTASTTNRTHSQTDFSTSSAFNFLKRILNLLGELAEAAVDRSRLAALPPRYLDDVDMTVGERVAILGYEEPARDPWALAATQRL
jgi:hypothetical protein